MSLCHKLGFLNLNFLKTKCRKCYIFQTMNSGGSNKVSWIFERYASSGWWDLGIIKLGFVAKTQFLYCGSSTYGTCGSLLQIQRLKMLSINHF